MISFQALKYLSIFIFNDCYFLHPKLASSASKLVSLYSKCSSCVTLKETKHLSSIKNANDFSNALRLGLIKIKPIKRCAIAVARLYNAMCKI